MGMTTKCPLSALGPTRRRIVPKIRQRALYAGIIRKKATAHMVINASLPTASRNSNATWIKILIKPNLAIHSGKKAIVLTVFVAISPTPKLRKTKLSQDKNE